MPPFGPISRRELIAHLREMGFDGPYAGGRHQHMDNGQVKVSIPNPHRGDISRALLREILRKAGISMEDWENL